MKAWQQYQYILSNTVNNANLCNFMHYLKIIIKYAKYHPELKVSLNKIPGYTLAINRNFASFKNVVMTLISLSEIKLYYIPNHINIRA